MKFKKIFSFIIIMLLMFSIAGCSENDGKGYIFKFALTDDPQNLDPQLATDEASLVVISNVFEGLLKIDQNGNIANGVCKDYTVSDDGSSYVFELRDDVYWTDKVSYENKQKRKLTANDFVFAFRRLVDPKTYSPYAKDYLCIKNAAAVISGEMPVDDLGVTAKGDNILVVELEYAYPEFLNLLTHTSAMPCNSDFFYNTNGKYGLEEDCVASNGPFYMKKWTYNPYDKDNYLILRKNETYFDTKNVYPSSLNFFVIRNDSDKTSMEKILADFKGEKYDCVIDDGSNSMLYEGKYNITGYDVGTSGIIINPASAKFENVNLRKAIANATERNKVRYNNLRGITAAYSIVPSNVTVLNKKFRELAPSPAADMVNKEYAQYIYGSNVTDTEKSNTTNVTVLAPKSYGYSDYVDDVLDSWQDVLDIFITVEIVADDEYKRRMSAGEYDLAVVELNGEYNSPSAFLDYFETNNEKNIFKFSTPKFDLLLRNAKTQSDLNKGVELYSQAEIYLIENGYYIPLFFHEKYLVSLKKSSGYNFNPFNNAVTFKYAKSK